MLNRIGFKIDYFTLEIQVDEGCSVKAKEKVSHMCNLFACKVVEYLLN